MEDVADAFGAERGVGGVGGGVEGEGEVVEVAGADVGGEALDGVGDAADGEEVGAVVQGAQFVSQVNDIFGVVSPVFVAAIEMPARSSVTESEVFVTTTYSPTSPLPGGTDMTSQTRR